MTANANLAFPRALRVGGGSSAELADVLAQAGLSRPLLVTDPFIAAQPFMAPITNGLDDAGIAYEVFTDVRPDPTSDSVERGAQVLRRGGYDSVVGIGGGSPMDTAKAVALLASHGGSMADYRAPAVTDVPSLPLIAIPTTAGSGSECTRFTIITDSATDEKMLCAGLAFLPIAALVDYRLTMGMPARLTADTGVDALVHAIESYVSRKSNPFNDGLALGAMRAIYPALRAVYADPADEAAREAMMLGATQAGLAISNASVALVHGMSRPIGARFHIAHGLSNAMLMPAVTAFSVDDGAARYAVCARELGVAGSGDDDQTAAHLLVDAVTKLNTDLEVPGPREYGIGERDWHEAIPTMAEQALASGSPANNPRSPSNKEVEELYRSLWV